MSTIDVTPSGGPVKKDDRLIYLISMAQLTLRTRINTFSPEPAFGSPFPRRRSFFCSRRRTAG